MWNLKNKMNEHTKNQSCKYREQTGGCQRGGGGGMGKIGDRVEVQTSNFRVDRSQG